MNEDQAAKIAKTIQRLVKNPPIEVTRRMQAELRRRRKGMPRWNGVEPHIGRSY